ncbi:MAG TPA: hypothetical protein VMU66_00175, partial [Gaiellales bacterium]|nr:hypothetical protein [Gaiellales bacterium]
MAIDTAIVSRLGPRSNRFALATGGHTGRRPIGIEYAGVTRLTPPPHPRRSRRGFRWFSFARTVDRRVVGGGADVQRDDAVAR